MKISIVQDLADLTMIPDKSLSKLVTKTIYCINEAIVEMLITEDDLCEVDIGIGTLYIKKIDNEIKYKFVPSAKLNDSIMDTIRSGQSALTDILDNTLKERILETYKELF